ncbi:MAG: TIGR03960 family B12-binding radical SAM protein [Candidatus Omnitrophica bacterium]|nr:TIGR03960 family B12-binding radical SAM protein [Candidatus Omnitrophota bacterium]
MAVTCVRKGITVELNEILNEIQKPARYTGGEINSVRKKFTNARTSVVLSYPDTYEVGMSYLGLRILYHLLNDAEDILCERVFMPYEDMRQRLRASGQKLFSLESRTPLDKFDIIGFSLSYELTYTNVLDILSSGGIEPLSNERGENSPLVIAGGALCYNPEPMTKFIDIFIVGDAEEALLKFVSKYKKLKKKKLSRKQLIRSLSEVEGVYAPSLYEAEFAGNKFLRLTPFDKNVPKEIKKNYVRSLEEAYYPVKQIVPFIRTVQDRIAVEIMRGCPNKCRFCIAMNVTRPVRLRKPETIRRLLRQTYKNTGYESFSLLSLSSMNYPDLAKLISAIKEDFDGEGIGVSIPSVRIDKSFYEIPGMISTLRKTGLTFALEAAEPQTRRSLGKDISFEVFRESASEAFRHGWRRLKLYFMVGFPGEENDTAEKIAGIAKEISDLRRTVSNAPAEIRLSINPFIPKAQTSFQWLGMAKEERLRETKEKFRFYAKKKIKFEFHDLKQSMLEGALSRGDRKTSEVIYSAWKNGAVMDGALDSFDFKIWEDAFRENGCDLYESAYKTYAVSDNLPWSHIKTGIDDEYLKAEFNASGFGIV